MDFMRTMIGAMTVLTAMALTCAAAAPARAAQVDITHTDGGDNSAYLSMERSVPTPWDLFLKTHFSSPAAFDWSPNSDDMSSAMGAVPGHLLSYKAEDNRIYWFILDHLGGRLTPVLLYTDILGSDTNATPGLAPVAGAEGFSVGSNAGLFGNTPPTVTPVVFTFPVPAPAPGSGLLCLTALPLLLLRRRRAECATDERG